MAEAPAFETQRLRVIPFSEQHLTARYVDWLNDPEVVRYSDQRLRRHTLESCRRYWGEIEGSRSYFWAIVAKDERLGHIGNMTAYVDAEHLVADLAIVLGLRAVWARGYGSEAWVAACDYLLGDGGMRKVTAGALATNSAMLGVMRRAGMVPDGSRVRQRLFEGREVDLVHTALFREEAPHVVGVERQLAEREIQYD